MKFTIVTLGCKVNQYESQVMREMLLNAGFTYSEEGEADIVILNSCTVTATSDHKVRQMLHRARRNHPSASVCIDWMYAAGISGYCLSL